MGADYFGHIIFALARVARLDFFEAAILQRYNLRRLMQNWDGLRSVPAGADLWSLKK